MGNRVVSLVAWLRESAVAVHGLWDDLPVSVRARAAGWIAALEGAFGSVLADALLDGSFRHPDMRSLGHAVTYALVAGYIARRNRNKPVDREPWTREERADAAAAGK